MLCLSSAWVERIRIEPDFGSILVLVQNKMYEPHCVVIQEGRAGGTVGHVSVENEKENTTFFHNVNNKRTSNVCTM